MLWVASVWLRMRVSVASLKALAHWGRQGDARGEWYSSRTVAFGVEPRCHTGHPNACIPEF